MSTWSEFVLKMMLTLLIAFLLSFATWIIDKVVGDKIFANVMKAACVKPMGEYMKLCEERDKFNRMVYDQACWPLIYKQTY